MNINNNFSNNIKFHAVAIPMSTVQNNRVQTGSTQNVQNNSEYFWPSA